MTSAYHEQSVRRIALEINAILTATVTAQCYRPLTAILEERYKVKFPEDMLFEINSGLPIRELAELVSCLVQRNYIHLCKPVVEVNQIVYLPTQFGYTKERVSKIVPLFSTVPEEFKKYVYYITGNEFPLVPNVDFYLTRKEAIVNSLKQYIIGK